MFAYINPAGMITDDQFNFQKKFNIFFFLDLLLLKLYRRNLHDIQIISVHYELYNRPYQQLYLWVGVKQTVSTYRFVVQTLDFTRQIRRFSFQCGHVPRCFRVELRPSVLVSIRFDGVDVTPATAAAVLVAAPVTLVRAP